MRLSKFPWLALGALWLAMPASAQTFSGRLDDPTNAALVASDLGAPAFDDDFAIANNVALYTFDVATAGSISIVSTGFASGGLDPYFSLFQGGTTGASFYGSNYVQAFATGGDFSFTSMLAAGAWQIAIGTFANMSFAENSGTGTLADGFIGLGVPSSLGDSHYSVTVSTGTVVPPPVTPIPEPSTTALMSLGLAATLFIRRRRRGMPEEPPQRRRVCVSTT